MVNNWYKKADADDFSAYSNVPAPEQGNQQVIEGLKKWVEDYKAAMRAGSVETAIQIRDNIKKDMALHKLPQNVRRDIWGEDPRKV